MPRFVTCPQGHHWELSANGGATDPKVACPVCGVTVALNDHETAPVDGIELLRAQTARLQQSLASEHPTLPPHVPLPDSPAPQPTQVGDYEIVGELGRGGMGVVYKALQTSLKRLVALKMLLPGAYCGDEERSRFRTEAEAAARLQHPNIVQIYEIGEADGRPYFSMEFIEGGSLAGRLGGTPLPSREAARMLEVLARAVHSAHERGVIHRDLKPANILLAGDGSPKITDFGLAKRLGRDSGQTQYGSIMGTPSYMAPEQVGGKSREVGAAADVYSLGAILYEMLAGRPPFRAATPLDTVLQVLSEEPLAPSRLQPKVSHDLETICLKCLNKDPRKRYASTLALAEDLHRYINHKPILARPVPLWERVYKWARRQPAAAALTIVLAAIAITALYGLFHRLEQHRQKLEAQVARKDLEAYFYGVRLAESHWRADRVGDAAMALVACARELRNWEWRYLERQCSAGLETLSGGGLSVALDPQGKRVAAGGPVNIWETSTGKPLALVGETIQGRRPTRRAPLGPAVAWSSNGKIIATASASNAIELWDSAAGVLIGTLKGHSGPIRSLAFSGDSRRLASGSVDGTAKVWDVGRRRLLADLPGHAGGVDALGISRDGGRLATTAHDGMLRVWNVPSGAPLLVMRAEGGDEAAAVDPADDSLRAKLRNLHAVALSSDGRVVAYGRGSLICRRDLATGKDQPPLAGSHRDRVRCLAFSPDGKRLVSGGADRVVVVWDLEHDRPLFRLRGHHDAVNAVAFSGDGRLIASTGFDASVHLWDAAVDPEARVLAGGSRVRGLAFAADRLLVSASDDGILRTWNLDSDRAPSKEAIEAGGARSVAFSGAAKLLAAGFADGSVRVWNGAGELLRVRKEHTKPVSAVSFNGDGSRLASASLDGTVRVWDMATGTCVRIFGNHQAAVYAVSFGPGTLVASGGADAAVRLWNADTGDEMFALGGHAGAITCVAFSRDGERLASGSVDGLVKLWSPREGREMTTYEGSADAQGNPDAVRALAFTPDGSRLASAGADQTIHLWEVLQAKEDPTRPEMLTLHVRGGEILALAFSPDGNWLASGGADGNVLLWDAGPIPVPPPTEESGL